jgi:dTDP-glucose 4,6-dehydratase
LSKTLIVTGGAGFIGSAVVRHLLSHTDHNVVTVDAMTYAANPLTLTELCERPRHRFFRVDIRHSDAMRSLFRDTDPDGVIHLAAESHVDRSIDRPADFITTNVNGTCTLLDVALEHWRSLGSDRKAAFRFHHVSTDEVYGSLSLNGQVFGEDHPYRPNSPYSASKAASDHFVRAWQKTFGLPAVITNTSNNYGPYQYPEKLIPLVTIKAMRGEELPVYGNGQNVRDWLFVEDHARALCAVFERGRIGECYLIGGDAERRNIDVVRGICALVDRIGPPLAQQRSALIRFVTDRPAHDLRYGLDSTKIRTELGWRPEVDFETGLERTVRWYLESESWWRPTLEGAYDGRRLGLGTGVGL